MLVNQHLFTTVQSHDICDDIDMQIDSHVRPGSGASLLGLGVKSLYILGII